MDNIINKLSNLFLFEVCEMFAVIVNVLERKI